MMDELFCKNCKGIMGCRGKWTMYAGLPAPCPFDRIKPGDETYLSLAEHLLIKQ